MVLQKTGIRVLIQKSRLPCFKNRGRQLSVILRARKDEWGMEEEY